MTTLLSSGTMPFSVSLLVLAGIVLIEIVLLLVGTHFFGLLDDLIPDLHADLDHDGGHELSFGKVLHFVGFGRVPFMMVLMSFLATFGLAGFVIQWVSAGVIGRALPYAGAIPLAFALALPATGRICAVLARILPKEQTSAVSAATFIGREAVVKYGAATVALPATAAVLDEHGRTHFIQVKAQGDDDHVAEGGTLLIVGNVDGFFIGRPAT
jgi:hypothetical protein